MKTPGAHPIRAAAEAALKTFAATREQGVIREPGIGAVVSPIHRGVESACFNVDAGDKAFFLKVRYPDMASFFNEASACAGARQAARLGIGARLVAADETSGSYLFERLAEHWAWGKVDDFENRTVLENTVRAKRALHGADALPSGRSVFETIEHYYDIIQGGGIKVPKTTAGIVEKVRGIGRAIAAAGIDKVPCHGDGVASNVMINPAGGVRLVDFDSAGNHDPCFDLGSLMVEIAQFPDLARAALEIYAGECRDAEFNRCMLYGIADDLKWALWGFISFARSSRAHVEFVKYAEWRLLRAIFNAEGAHFDRWMARL